PVFRSVRHSQMTHFSMSDRSNKFRMGTPSTGATETAGVGLSLGRTWTSTWPPKIETTRAEASGAGTRYSTAWRALRALATITRRARASGPNASLNIRRAQASHWDSSSAVTGNVRAQDPRVGPGRLESFQALSVPKHRRKTQVGS